MTTIAELKIILKRDYSFDDIDWGELLDGHSDDVVLTRDLAEHLEGNAYSILSYLDDRTQRYKTTLSEVESLCSIFYEYASDLKDQSNENN